MFDPWQFLSPKRRKMLDQGWPGFFRHHILTLQETSRQLSYDIQWHCALDIVEESVEAKYICPKTLWSMRLFATELGLEAEVIGATADKLAELFTVDTSRQRIDSVHIRSNMARLGRIGIFAKAIEQFLVNLKRHHRPLWEQPEQISGASLQNPSDPDATFSGHKGQGYQVQVMETYSEQEGDKKATELNLISHVEVEKACQSDAQALVPAIEASLTKPVVGRPPAFNIGNKIRVMPVDDHGVMRNGLSTLLGNNPDIDVVGESSDGGQAVRPAREILPDVILMDINMPKMNGLEAARRIHAEFPHIRIIVLTMREGHDDAAAAFSAGASAFLPKSGDTDRLLAVIRGETE